MVSAFSVILLISVFLISPFLNFFRHGLLQLLSGGFFRLMVFREIQYNLKQISIQLNLEFSVLCLGQIFAIYRPRPLPSVVREASPRINLSDSSSPLRFMGRSEIFSQKR